MRGLRFLSALLFICPIVGNAAPVLAPPPLLGDKVGPFVRFAAGRYALTHVRVIDGTGAAPVENRTVLIDGSHIVAVRSAADAPPSGYREINVSGATVIPGIVGMHDHIYYIARPNLDAEGRSEPPLLLPQMTFSAPRLYLANGITTIRTTGSVEPYADLNLKQQIDSGSLPGPHMDVTGPYLEGPGSRFIQMHSLKDAEDARQTVAFWADRGATSFKAYTNITRGQLKAAIDEAHRRGLKVTGHLCSVTYVEAAELGIDNLEHGFRPNTQLDPGKRPDECPSTNGIPTLIAMKAGGPEATKLIELLVTKGVALTSTLAVFEHSLGLRSPLVAGALDAMTPGARDAFLYQRNRAAADVTGRQRELTEAFENGLKLERQFVTAGGLLLVGSDPTGNGGVVPGFGDHRSIELLVEAGFTPLEAIRMATLNGATYLGLADRIGSIAAGKHADLIVLRGNPAAQIRDIEKVEIVFKDGVGYDPVKLLESARSRYGQY